jgi:uncharacterized membrane protein YfcA
MDPLLVLFGFGVGALVGVTGMGGGSLMTPLLILLFGVKPTVAVGTDLSYAAITKTVGGWRHLRKGTVQLSMAAWLAVGSCPGALLGVWLLKRLGIEEELIPMIAGALLLTGTLVLMRALVLSVDGERGHVPMGVRQRAGAVALGLAVGFLLGVTSAGSGTLIAIGLILGFRMSPRRVVGTDVAHAAVLLWVAALAHLASGNVDLGMAGTILLGSIPGVWLGAHLATRLPERALRPGLGIVLLTSGLGLLSKSVSIPAWVLIAVPLALCAVAYAVLRRRDRAAARARDTAPATT